MTGAEPNVEPSIVLMAETVTVCCESILDGAVYRPVGVRVPGELAGIDQLTEGALLQAADAMNCLLCPAYKAALEGIMVAFSADN